MIMLDTNVISEPLRKAPESRVIEWIDAQAIETLFLSAITVAEVRFGVALLPPGKRKDRLRDRLESEVVPLFAERVLPFDLAVTRTYAELMAKARATGLTIGTSDGLIAATAAANRMTIATRDTKPFAAAGVPTMNPWESSLHEA